MALVFWDGLDSYNNTTELSAAHPGYIGEFGAAINGTGGRWGGRHIVAASTSFWERYTNSIQLIDDTSDIWKGFAFWSRPESGYLLVSRSISPANNNIYTQAVVHYNGSKQNVEVYRGNYEVLIGESANGSCLAGRWHFCEIRHNMSQTTGGIEVWVDNVQIYTTPLNSNTQMHLGPNNIDFINLACGNFMATDDIYVVDSSGLLPFNGRLGDVRMYSMTPINDANPNNGTPSTGFLHYDMVNEPLGWDSSDNIALLNQADQEERFGLDPLPGLPNTIFSTAIVYTSRKSDTGPAKMHSVLYVDGYISNGEIYAPTSSDSIRRDEWLLNPDTNAPWELEDINTLRIGVRVDTPE